MTALEQALLAGLDAAERALAPKLSDDDTDAAIRGLIAKGVPLYEIEEELDRRDNQTRRT